MGKKDAQNMLRTRKQQPASSNTIPVLALEENPVFTRDKYLIAFPKELNVR
jgi:hypothetical protein